MSADEIAAFLAWAGSDGPGRSWVIGREEAAALSRRLRDVEIARAEFGKALARAAYVARNLIEAVPEFTGVVSPDGHREDDAIRESLAAECAAWAELAGVEPPENEIEFVLAMDRLDREPGS